MYENKIVGNADVPLDDILFNPDNWRIHPKYQQEVLDEVLKTIGIIQGVIINQTTGRLIDGHLRVQLAERANMETIPAVFVNLTEEEEKLAIATFDPIVDLAVADRAKIDELLGSIDAEGINIQSLLKDLAEKYDVENFKTDDINFDEFSQVENQSFLFKVVIENIQSKEEAVELAKKFENSRVEQYRVA